MWTGRTAAVGSVTAAPAAAGSRFSGRASMAAKTGRARSKSTALALATNEKGEVTTSSPSDTPTARSPRCSPAVPLDRSEEHTSELQSGRDLGCRVLLEQK